MNYELKIGDRELTLTHGSLDRSIDVDTLTTIDVGNIYGEHVTVSAAVNRIGLIKAEVESRMNKAKIDYKIYESKFKAKLRAEASLNGNKYTINVDGQPVYVKLTETSLSTSFEDDKVWIEKKMAFIDAEKNFNQLDVLYWAMQDKSRKLNGLVSGTTPEEYVKEMIEGKVNGILIKKVK